VDLPHRLTEELEDLMEVLAAKDVVANRASIVRGAPKTDAPPLIK
jgi:hypothetical protein